MNQLFISEIYIRKVRHLENIRITTKGDTLTHIILTGKNGSGKTSVLLELKGLLFNYLKTVMSSLKAVDESRINYLTLDYFLDSHKDQPGVTFKFNELYNSSLFAAKCISNNGAITAFFPAHRVFGSSSVEAIKPLSKIKSSALSSGIENPMRKQFVDYMISLDYIRLSSIEENDSSTAKSASDWFNNFESILRKIYDCNELTLRKSKEEMDYYIAIPGREPFNFNQLSDGYGSVLDIIAEIMMRYDFASIPYDSPGIIIIDEIETHMHVKLQKDILPILTQLFPNAQFILSTHSPFVLSSVKNSVVYDLESKTEVTDMSLYSYQGIVEHYFGENNYTHGATEALNRYIYLSEYSSLSDAEKQEMSELANSFLSIPDDAASELKSAFLDYELRRRMR